MPPCARRRAGCDAVNMIQVYVFDVEDADAGTWTSEVAVVASKPAEAARRIRAAGLHKKQIRNDARPTRVVGLAEVIGIDESPTRIVRRRREDDGWTEWEPVAAETSLNWRVSGDAVVQTRGSGHR
jgi:hypothetical protein